MKIPLPISKHKNNASSAEQSCGRIQGLQRKLAQNALAEFKIGFEGGEFRCKGDVQSLINTIRDQYLHKLSMDKVSCLESISIGWKLPRFALGPVLQQVVPLLLQKPAKVQNLQLMINAWAPLPTIERLVSWHTLETLDLRSLRIRTRAVSDPTPTTTERGRRFDKVSARARKSLSPSSTAKAESTCDSEGYITSDESVLAVLPYVSQSVKTLKLVDCDLEVRHMPSLTRILRKKRHITSLCLRLNRRLYLNGWHENFFDQLPFLETLDLSICDLSPFDGLRLAAALNASTDSGLKRLSVAGNFRLGEAIPEIVEACASMGIIELDCSFCDIHSKPQAKLFDLLARQTPCSIQSLKMQAVRLKEIGPLIRCIQDNTSLRRIIIDHPREPYEVSSEATKRFLEVIRNNYHLEEFRFDPPHNHDEKILEEMKYWMTLNRCGRSILVQETSKQWPEVLANIAELNDIDTFYWILRLGAEQFQVV